MTPLNEAAFLGQTSLLKTLLLHGADPGIEDDAGTLPLWFAIDNMSYENVRLLLAAGSPIQACSSLSTQCGPCNPLEHAVHRQRAVFVHWMVAVYGDEASNVLRRCLPNLELNPSIKLANITHWKEMVRQPQPLLVQCRRTVLRIIRKPAVLLGSDQLKDLNIPQLLRNYLCLQDLSEVKTVEQFT